MKEHQIYQILRDAIFNADLPPGTQLVESALAESFQVSRTPIRSVLQRLKHEHLVQIVPNRGAYVYCPNPEEAQHIFFVRELLEPEATALAALHATESDLERMESLLQQELEWYQLQEPVKALPVVEQLHLAIIEASRNPYLIRYLKETISLTHIIFTFYDVSHDHCMHSYKEHEALFQAIRDKNAEEAKRIAYQHVLSIRQDVDFNKPLKSSQSIEYIIGQYTT